MHCGGDSFQAMIPSETEIFYLEYPHHPLDPRMRLFHILVLFTLLTTVFPAQPLPAQSLLIDGRFADWNAVPAAASDASGDGGASGIDFRMLRIAHDDDRVYIQFDTGTEMLLQEDNTLQLYIDTDGSAATGQQVHGMGAELTWTFGGREGQVRYDFNILPVNHAAIGLTPSPTMTSTRFELALDRAAQVGGQQLISGDSIRVKLVVGEPDGDRIPDGDGGAVHRLDAPGIDPPEQISLQPKAAGAARLLTWNVLRDGLTDRSRQDAFARILTAVQPDIMCFQECFDATAGQVLLFVRAVIDPPAGRSWRTLKLDQGNVLITHFDIEDSWEIQPGYRESAYLLRSPAGDPMLLINAHLRCCGADEQRQEEADGVIAFLRDAKSFDGRLTLARGTPMVMAGDFNLVGDRRQYETLITGDIADNTRYGPDTAPDWEGRDWTDLVSRHPRSPLAYTWLNNRSSYTPARLDYILYTGATMDIASHMVINTAEFSAVALAQLGLQSGDSQVASDHFPRYADLVWRDATSVEDAAPAGFRIAAVYPQPTRDALHVRLDAAVRPVTITLHDLLGRELQRADATPDIRRITFDVAGMQPGLYIVRVTDGRRIEQRTIVVM